MYFYGTYSRSLKRMQRLTTFEINPPYKENTRNENPIFVEYMLQLESAFFKIENYSSNIAWERTAKFESQEPF